MSLSELIIKFIHWAVSGLAVIMTAYIVPGFKVRSFLAAVATAVLIGLANLLIWPVLIFLTLPLNILTLGLFTFVVNGMVLKICAAFFSGFEIQTWTAAILGAIVLSLVSAGLHYLLV
jgi:putative membrane protein